jgi:hypothetical protein
MKTYKYTCRMCHSVYKITISNRQAVRYFCCPICGSVCADVEHEKDHDENILAFEDWVDMMNRDYPDYDPIELTEYAKWRKSYEDHCIRNGKAYEIKD